MCMTEYSINSTILNNLLRIGKANVTTDFYHNYYNSLNSSTNSTSTNTGNLRTLTLDVENTDATILSKSFDSDTQVKPKDVKSKGRKGKRHSEAEASVTANSISKVETPGFKA